MTWASARIKLLHKVVNLHAIDATRPTTVSPRMLCNEFGFLDDALLGADLTLRRWWRRRRRRTFTTFRLRVQQHDITVPAVNRCGHRCFVFLIFGSVVRVHVKPTEYACDARVFVCVCGVIELFLLFRFSFFSSVRRVTVTVITTTTINTVCALAGV